MIETKGEIINWMKMSNKKAYFTINRKLSWNFMYHITLYENTKK